MLVSHALFVDELHVLEASAEDLHRIADARMLARLGGETVSQENLRPDLALLEETAECRLSRTNSDLTIKFEKTKGEWLVTDLAMDSQKAGEDITSVRNMARAIQASRGWSADSKPSTSSARPPSAAPVSAASPGSRRRQMEG